MTKYYKVAGHVFGMTAEPAHLEDCANYEPFGCSDEDDAVFMLRVESGEAPAFTEEMRQEDEGLHQTENRLATSVPTCPTASGPNWANEAEDLARDRHSVSPLPADCCTEGITHRATVCEMCDDKISLTPAV